MDAAIRIEPADCTHQSYVPFAEQGLRRQTTSVVGGGNVDNEMPVLFDQDPGSVDVVLVEPATAQRVISIDIGSSGWCGRLLHVTYHVAVCGRPRCAGIVGRGQ